MVSSSFKILLIELSGKVEIFNILVGGCYAILDATVSTYSTRSLFWKLNLSGYDLSESRGWGIDPSHWKPSGLPGSAQSSCGLSQCVFS